MIIATGYEVNFTDNQYMGIILGFESKSYEAKGQKRFTSENMVQILTVNLILTQVSGYYLNGEKVSIVHSFFRDVEPGDKLVYSIYVQYIYLPIFSDNIRHMKVWLKDQNQNLLNLQEEVLTIRFPLGSC